MNGPDTETLFEERFEGVWRKRWWQLGPRLVRIHSYDLGKLSGDIVAVHGVDDDDDDVTFKVGASTRSLPGYRKTAS